MLVNYKQTLETARKYGVDPIMLTVATEIEGLQIDLLNKTMNDKEFELCCSLVEDSYLKAENITISQLVRALFGIIERYIYENDYEGTLEEIIKNIDKTTLIDEACWYD